LALAVGVWAQEPAPRTDPAKAAEAAAKSAVQQARPPGAAAPVQVPKPNQVAASLMTIPGKTLIATVDGKEVTAAELQGVIRTMPPQMQRQALGDRKTLLQYYGVMRRLSQEAETAKLDQVSPWKETLENSRMQLLMQAMLNRKFSEIKVGPEEEKKFYESKPERFSQAKVKAIYIPFSNSPPAEGSEKKPLTEGEAKTKAADLVKQIRSGADFVKLVKEHSGDPASVAKDGDFGTIRRTDQLPNEIKAAVFAVKAGEVTEPVRQASGFYIFRVEEASPQSFEEVRATVQQELKNARFMEWMAGVQNSVDIKLLDQGSAEPSPPQPPAAK
jgi:parvulin-like peptidyl-prolyl isomerase